MKRPILLFFLVVLTTALSAQHRWAFGLELEGGYSGRSDLYEETFPGSSFAGGDAYNRIEEKRYPGAGLGVWGSYLLTHHLEFQLGLNYGQWSTHVEFESIDHNLQGVIRSFSHTDYYQQQRQMRIPLLAKWYFGSPNRSTRIFLTGGLHFVHLLQQTNTIDNFVDAAGLDETFEETIAEEVDLKSDWLGVDPWQTSFVAGAGFAIDRASFSIEHTWGEDRSANYPYGCFGGVFANCVRIFEIERNRVKRLEQTSIHFRYRLF
ncbi:MAG: outer membrane beta-barrel protein [Lewinella sp.]|jgi:hypothetical protein|uniref:outer membrane beta-barrel protein n=1 Tax=Lewinella sp. TaxID=2004506 RepID=UPI003D6B9E7C